MKSRVYSSGSKPDQSTRTRADEASNGDDELQWSVECTAQGYQVHRLANADPWTGSFSTAWHAFLG